MPTKSPTAPPRKAKAKRPLDRDTASSGPTSTEISHKGAAMPHERDELAERPSGPPDPDIAQAYRDIESGQADTDLRGTATGHFKRSAKASAKPSSAKPR